MKINYLILLFSIICFCCSCSNKLKGTYCSDVRLQETCMTFEKDHKFYYFRKSDQGSIEGYGNYTIQDSLLLLNFGDNRRIISDDDIKYTKNTDNLHLKIYNRSDIVYRLELVAEATNYGDKKDYDIQPGDYIIHKIPYKKGIELRLSLYEGSYSSVLTYLNTPGSYEINHVFKKGIQGTRSNLTSRYELLKWNKDTIAFKRPAKLILYKQE